MWAFVSQAQQGHPDRSSSACHSVRDAVAILEPPSELVLKSRLGHRFLVLISVRQAQQEPVRQHASLLDKLEYCRAAGFKAFFR